MEETQKVVSSDYLKHTRHLGRHTLELERVKATNEQLHKEGKYKEAKVTCLQSIMV